MEKVLTVWLQDLKDKDKRDQRTKSVINFQNDPMTKLLIKILEAKEKELEALRSNDYNDQSWAYKQADNNGARRMLRQVKELINTHDHI